MSTNARIGYVLNDDSIVSVYHHWDGYPEWLGVVLNREYNTDAKVKELIDGGNMSSCYSDNNWDGSKCDPRPVYYTERGESLDDNAPRLSKTLSDLSEVNDGSEYVYLWFMNSWNCYEIDRKFDDEWNVVNTTLSVRIIPPDHPQSMLAV
tara:strand:- start:75 stop:524 length:450 start_codon:yes stop_codon:yes gene_type:complete